MVDHTTTTTSASASKRKRRPAGTPDPEAEVVTLSAKTLLESDRYVCEICKQGFQREQNLQMHRRRHKVPWKLLKRDTHDVRKRVFVCPEPTCLHHHPSHALGDLVGIKKHFRRKHSNRKHWLCHKCTKAYAVHSDYKAHLKTCGTRGHSCDCGRVFSRVESFIEHQDSCTTRRADQRPPLQPACSASSTNPSRENNFTPLLAPRPAQQPSFLNSSEYNLNHASDQHHRQQQQQHSLELQLLPSRVVDEYCGTHLKLSLAPGEAALEVARMKEEAGEHLRLALAEKAYAEDFRRQARKENEVAELEFANAKRMRQQAQAELDKAHQLKEQATKKMSSTLMQITCQACKQQFQSCLP